MVNGKRKKKKEEERKKDEKKEEIKESVVGEDENEGVEREKNEGRRKCGEENGGKILK